MDNANRSASQQRSQLNCEPATLGREASVEVFAGMPIRARIVIDMLPDGRCRLSSTCWGQHDSSYSPFHDEKAYAEVPVLMAEIRRRLAGFSRV